MMHRKAGNKILPPLFIQQPVAFHRLIDYHLKPLKSIDWVETLWSVHLYGNRCNYFSALGWMIEHFHNWCLCKLLFDICCHLSLWSNCLSILSWERSHSWLRSSFWSPSKFIISNTSIELQLMKWEELFLKPYMNCHHHLCHADT